MTEQEVADRFTADSALLLAWGQYVTDRVCDSVLNSLPDGKNREQFFRIRPAPRLKSVQSFLDKAFRRGKRYSDPYSDITDHVGTRFVVLLLSEIELVKHAVEQCGDWVESLDRDFEDERNREPLLFQYQSVHYVVRARREIGSSAGVIPERMPCEVQIRTLLQHAYGELSHDTIYKPNTQSSPPEVVREIARSMALIETTDMAFEHASRMLADREAVLRADLSALSDQYYEATGQKSEDSLPVALSILDAFRTLTPPGLPSIIQQFRAKHPYLAQIVQERRKNDQIYNQAIVFLLYYLIDKYRSGVLRNWPLPEDELAPLFSDLGIARP